MLDLNALHVLHCAAAAGGIGAAARKLGVTQPAVSQRLRALERQAGERLYGRAGNRFVLTDAGRRLVEACRSSFEALERAGTAPESKIPGMRGGVRITALSEFAKAFLLPRIESFHRRHPGVRFQVEYRHPYEMLPLLLRHETDMIFTNETCDKAQVESAAIFLEDFVMVGRGPRRRLSWADLGRLPWLSCRSEDGYWFELERMLSARGLKLPPPLIEVAEIESLLMLAGRGVGVAMVPRHAVELRRLPELATHQVPFRRLTETIRGCRLKTVPPGEAAEAFWRLACERKTSNFSKNSA
jgi:DNA-binding transcriptional LysR family regulator